MAAIQTVLVIDFVTPLIFLIQPAVIAPGVIRGNCFDSEPSILTAVSIGIRRDADIMTEKF